MSEGFTILPHPADVGLRAWGVDLPTALDQAVRALATIELSGEPPSGGERREVELQGSPEELLVELLEECLYLLDAEDWLAVGAQLRYVNGVLTGALLGLPFRPEAHDDGVHVKAITWHQLSVEWNSDGVALVVYLDI